MKKSSKKVTKLERTQQKKELLEYRQQGTGHYVFRNKSKVATLELPKLSKDGKKWVQPKETWEGDSYFFNMVPRDAVLVKVIEEAKKEATVEKLILDQPDQITSAGKVEHTVVQGEVSLNETTPQENVDKKEKLLTEDPLAGVTIIRD